MRTLILCSLRKMPIPLRLISDCLMNELWAIDSIIRVLPRTCPGAPYNLLSHMGQKVVRPGSCQDHQVPMVVLPGGKIFPSPIRPAYVGGNESNNGCMAGNAASGHW